MTSHRPCGCASDGAHGDHAGRTPGRCQRECLPAMSKTPASNHEDKKLSCPATSREVHMQALTSTPKPSSSAVSGSSVKHTLPMKVPTPRAMKSHSISCATCESDRWRCSTCQSHVLLSMHKGEEHQRQCAREGHHSADGDGDHGVHPGLPAHFGVPVLILAEEHGLGCSVHLHYAGRAGRLARGHADGDCSHTDDDPNHHGGQHGGLDVSMAAAWRGGLLARVLRQQDNNAITLQRCSLAARSLHTL